MGQQFRTSFVRPLGYVRPQRFFDPFIKIIEQFVWLAPSSCDVSIFLYYQAKYYTKNFLEETQEKDANDSDAEDDLSNSEPESDVISIASSYSGTGRSRRVKYSVHELNTILRLCSSFIRSTEPIRADDVEEIFTRNKTLKPILKKFGLSSIVIKIRTERGKLRKC